LASEGPVRLVKSPCRNPWSGRGGGGARLAGRQAASGGGSCAAALARLPPPPFLLVRRSRRPSRPPLLTNPITQDLARHADTHAYPQTHTRSRLKTRVSPPPRVSPPHPLAACVVRAHRIPARGHLRRSRPARGLALRAPAPPRHRAAGFGRANSDPPPRAQRASIWFASPPPSQSFSPPALSRISLPEPPAQP
jgi:hypothetical protein